MIRRSRAVLPLIYPVLFAASVVLGIASRSAGQYRVSDLLVVLAVVVFATALALAGAFAAMSAVGSNRAAPLAAALTMIAVGWCFFYTATQNALAPITPQLARHRVLMPLAIVVTLAVLAWLLRQSRDRLLALGRFMTSLGLVLVVLVVLPFIAQGRGPQAARASRLARELARPLRTTGVPPASRNTPPRDIYLIVLDGHANARVLGDVLGFDNARFEDALRALGFVIPRDVRSNYVQTYLSLASLLNAAHVTQLTEDAGATSKDHSLPTYLIQHNRIARFLKDRGYKYVLFPSAWWAATSTSPLADETFDGRRRFDLMAELHRTELRAAVLRSSLLRAVLPRGSESPSLTQHFLRTFEGLREVARGAAPKFTFAHILLPHVPYVLDERCRPLERAIPDWMDADTPEQRAAYIAQVRCVDGLVLDLVRTLLARSSTPPVILVVGDHGPRFSDARFYDHPERVSSAFIRERFGAFGAFYLPAGGDGAFRDTVTLVNVLGHVLRYYFNADLPVNADDMYVSGEQLYRFYRVDSGARR